MCFTVNTANSILFDVGQSDSCAHPEDFDSNNFSTFMSYSVL
jgi:hypothetical protein